MKINNRFSDSPKILYQPSQRPCLVFLGYILGKNPKIKMKENKNLYGLQLKGGVEL